MSNSISLLVPGLSAVFQGIAAEAFPDAPVLSRCLSRSKPHPFVAQRYEQAVFTLFGFPDHGSLPVAPLRYLGDGGDSSTDFCLCADPVHLRTDTRGLVLFDQTQFTLEDADHLALATQVADFVQQDGWRLEALTPQHWYLFAPRPDELNTSTLTSVRGMEIGKHLPTGKDGKHWQAWMNEIQMLMHSSPVSLQRSQNRQVAVNSLWVWGGGTLPIKTGTEFDGVITNDALLTGLAKHADIPCRQLAPQHADDVLEVLAGGNTLISWQACEPADDYQDFSAWSNAIQQFEANWMTPLLYALNSKRLDYIELIPLNGCRYRIRPGHRYQFWKPVKSYRSFRSK